MELTFHHIGRPVPVDEIRDDPKTRYSPLFDMYTLDLPNELGLHIQLHAFGERTTLDPRLTRESHVAFTVPDIEAAIAGHEVVMPLYEPFAGYSCAAVLVNHQVVELVETRLTESEIWGGSALRDSALYPGE